MQITSHDTDGLDNQFRIQMGPGREAYLVIRKDSHPLMVASASANVSTGTFDDTRSAIQDASEWLLEEIRQGRVQLK